MEKFTLLDFPGRVASILFYNGCNIHCPYCYNDSVCKGKYGSLPPEDVKNFLVSRQGKIDGVVFSGGECTLTKGIVEDIRAVKEMGFMTKLDTNGTRPDVVETLLSERLLDYVALDVKCNISNWGTFFPKNTMFADNVKTLSMLLESGVPFEARTTVHTGVLDENDINQIIKDLESSGYKGKYYLQFFFETPETLEKVGPMPRKFNIHKLDTRSLSVDFRNAEGNICCDADAL